MLSALLSLLAVNAFATEDSLRCELARAGERWASASPVMESQAVVKGDSLGLELDSSLGPQSYLVVLADEQRKLRLAFTGTADSVSPDGSALQLGNASLHCGRASSVPSFAPPPKAEYVLCLLDEARFVRGVPVESKRRITRRISPFNARMPFILAAEDEAVSFRVSVEPLDAREGLSVSLTDRASGEIATYRGPARSFGTSFLFGLTLGDRATSARFLRLGCVRTDDPSAF